jgi:Ca-activated chloride channel family protein
VIPEYFHFLRPWWLLALLPLLVTVWLMLKKKLGSRDWETVIDPELLPYVLTSGRGSTRRLPALLTAVCGLLAIFALAGPVWDKLPQPVYSSRSSLVIALDLSRSMDANDIDPSRLVRARYKIRDILNRRPEGQTALLVYAGDAFTVTPLTDDTGTIASQLDALTTDIMPVQGNRTDLALRLAGKLLRQAGAGRGDILLITDEVNLARGRDVAKKLRGENYRISVLGVGTRRGVPIPLADGSFLTDAKGQIVIPVLDEAPMRKLVAAGGGIYLRLRTDDVDIDTLLRLFHTVMDNGVTATRLKTDVWREQGPWLLLLLLPLAALAFRRGYMLVLLCLLLPVPRPARAMDWDSLWLRSDQRAARALHEGRNKEAARLFRDPAWKGAAKYRAGDYDGAIKSLNGLKGPENLYNLGNALARAGRYQAALNAYDKALQQDPGNEDAKYNRKLVEDYLKKQQQKQKQKSKQGKGEKKPQPGQQRNNNGSGRKNKPRPQQQQQGQQQKQNQAGRQQGDREQQKPSPQHAEQKPRPEQSPQNGSMKKEGQADRSAAAPSVKKMKPDEEQQAIEQWLRRIPDDPSGLLRRKFLYQYQQRERERPDSDEKTW